MIAKSTTIKDWGGKYGGCVVKAVVRLPREACAVSWNQD